MLAHIAFSQSNVAAVILILLIFKTNIKAKPPFLRLFIFLL